ncbi:MAG: Sec-independent protein translocase protein TatB [Acetobacteraceae bacterium]
MFNFSWSEIALIVAVALIAIGPKDLPVALKTMAQMMKKARGMASEFQGHVNELMREADLEDVKKQFDEIRHFDFKGGVERAIDPDHSIRDTLTEDPFTAADGAAASARVVEPLGEATELAPELAPDLTEPIPVAVLAAPSFVPPAVVTAIVDPPSFVPPDLLSSRS